MFPGNKLELLAPAKNLECGFAAIRHGADAVYIGAPRFSSREAAGNSIEEIEKLAAEARIFGAKTYVALNTILYDNELEEAERIIWQVYEAGADALIIQDFGILEMNLPPIPLHASTQANNFTLEKVRFLEAVGFKRAVLARELSLDQMRDICTHTTIETEAFVHGSLCVSLSGQCYLSHTMGGRSANRGACAQPCRKKYSLEDATGKLIVSNKYLLSLKDLNRSGSLGELAMAGIRSFKIEGRLKDVDYVKNITAYYRLELDRFLAENGAFEAASSGKSNFFFTPDPVKTFHRGATEYFLHGRRGPVAAMESPKSTGEEIGEVIQISRDAIRISGEKTISNNDGLTFLGRDGESSGLKVNKVENGLIYPDRLNEVYVGARIFRNFDHRFQMELSGKTAERKIAITIILQETIHGFSLTGYQGVTFELNMPKIKANDAEKSRENIRRQLGKSGDTPFLIREIQINGNEQYFFTAQQLNELRRGYLDQLHTKSAARPNFRSADSQPQATDPLKGAIPLPTEAMVFEHNISNRLAIRFYKRHGLEKPVMAVEKQMLTSRQQVMITRHCLQAELGFCTRFGGKFPAGITEPFTLLDGENRLELGFDCKNCMMKIFRVMK